MGKPVNKTLRIAAMSAGEEIGHVSGPIVTFRGNGAPLRSLLVNIEPVQDLHGYDNPWPAGGGKNLFDKDAVEMDKWIDVNTTTISPAIGYAVTDYMPVTQGQTYYIGAKGSVRSAYYDTNKNGIAYFAYVGGSSFTAEHTGFVRFTLYAVDMPALLSTLQFEKGSTATTYAPYSNLCPISGWTEANVWVKPTYDPTADPTATLQLGQTVYGGTLDVTNGVLTVDRAMEQFQWGDYAATDDLTVTTRRKFTISDVAVFPASSNTRPYCNVAKWAENYILDTVHFYVNNIKQALVFLPIGTDDSTTIQLCYTLATPITIPLTHTEISTLQGQNNVWADSGDVDVEYIATGGEGGKLALLLRNRKELLIALRKGLSPAEVGLLNSTPLLGGFVRPGLSTNDEKEEDELL